MIHHGDCLDILPTLDADSVDACVTDPPYGLAFMGKDWDHGVPGEAYWREVSRVLKPGGHLLAFGGTRTHHRLMVAIEDAGFEIRDCLMWLYGSGFPKSLDVSKAIDAHATLGGSGSKHLRQRDGRTVGTVGTNMTTHRSGRNDVVEGVEVAPLSTEAAQQWVGWGTALKPAYEPIILARKPLAGTVAQNTLAHGTAGLNIDATRIGYASDADLAFTQRTSPPGAPVFTNSKYGANRPEGIVNPTGRWPANVVLDEEAARLLDEQSGERKGATSNGKRVLRDDRVAYGKGWGEMPQLPGYGDTGGASRFFYTAKASRAERGAYNDHPTVKPLALMRWLVRLVTPSGGVVLDPFLGSGTTALACQREGFGCIGIERDEHSVEIALRRLEQTMLPLDVAI